MNNGFEKGSKTEGGKSLMGDIAEVEASESSINLMSEIMDIEDEESKNGEKEKINLPKGFLDPEKLNLDKEQSKEIQALMKRITSLELQVSNNPKGAQEVVSRRMIGSQLWTLMFVFGSELGGYNLEEIYNDNKKKMRLAMEKQENE